MYVWLTCFAHPPSTLPGRPGWLSLCLSRQQCGYFESDCNFPEAHDWQTNTPWNNIIKSDRLSALVLCCLVGGSEEDDDGGEHYIPAITTVADSY